MFASPEFKKKYKVQNNFQPSVDDYTKALRVSFVNFWLLGQTYAVLVVNMAEWRGSATGPVMPTGLSIIRDIVAFVAGEGKSYPLWWWWRYRDVMGVDVSAISFDVTSFLQYKR
jgi:hypothetical protein